MNPRQDRGPGDLITVEMQDRNHGAIRCRDKEFVGMPTSDERTGFRFTISDDATRDEIRIIKHGSVGVEERVTQLTTLVNRAERLRRRMTWDAARKGELREQALHSF